MSMKEAFENFFAKMNNLWNENMNCYPKYPYIEKYQPNILKKLFIPGTYSNGYVQWQPKLQDNNVNFEEVERELGCKIHSQIKDYFSTYWFLRLNGKVGENIIYLNPIFPNVDILSIVKNCIEKGKYHYQQSEIFFAIGFASVDGDDSYGVCVNNETCEVTCVQFQDRISIKIADSLEELLNIMDGTL